MDKKSSYIMLWIIIVVILPFVINALIKRMRLMKLLNSFKKSLKEQNLNISQHEVIHRKYAIGIDKEAKRLAYLNSKNESSLTVIDLTEISSCKVKISDKIANNTTHSVELTFLPRNNTRPELKLELYNNPAFMPSSDDIAIAQKWADLTNTNLV